MIQNNKLFFLLLFFIISACSSIPLNTADGCSIFSEKYFWYKYAKKTESKWGVPIHIQLAFIKKESDFKWMARPERTKLYKVIPYKRNIGTCYVKTQDINGWLVKNGYALAYKKYSKKYVIEEQYAKENKLGLWKGTFIRPEKWRRIMN